MKKLLLLLLLFPILCFGQSKEKLDLIKKWEDTGYFKRDGDNIVVSSIVNDLDGNKNELFIRVKSFLSRNYNNSQSVIQTEDKEAGIIIGKGYYPNIYNFTANLIVPVSYSCYHILRIDIKDGRIRIICSVDTWIAEWRASGNNYTKEEHLVVNLPPYTEKKVFGLGKDRSVDAFINLISRMHNTIASLEKSVRDGSLKIENDDW